MVGEQMDHAVTPSMLEMLQLVYAGQGIHANGHVLVNVEKTEAGNVGLYVEPIAMRELPGGLFALVTNAQKGAEDGPMSAHADGGILGIALLRKQQGKWKLARHFQHIATLGSNGYVGEVQWILLADGKPGIAVLNGMTAQGFSEQGMSLFDLTDGAIHDLTSSIPVLSTSEGACTDTRPECWSIESKWHVEKNRQSAYDDLVIEYTGFREKRKDGEADTVPRVRAVLASHARYSFKDGKYQLVDGQGDLARL